MLQPGDRVLYYTDGIIEEHVAGGELIGEDRLSWACEAHGPRRLHHAAARPR